MLQQGLIEEVAALKKRADLNLDLPSMRSVGYRQVWEYLNNDYDYDEMRFKGSCGNTTTSQTPIYMVTQLWNGRSPA
jgi:tRNA A37 N6-isopentenylltransferase MiaA